MTVLSRFVQMARGRVGLQASAALAFFYAALTPQWSVGQETGAFGPPGGSATAAPEAGTGATVITAAPGDPAGPATANGGPLGSGPLGSGTADPAMADPSAVDPAAVDPSLPPGVDAGLLPHDLSPWGMFLAADYVVKAVMIGLAFASVVTWTVWLAKSLELASSKGRLRRAARAIGEARSLDEAVRQVGAGRGVANLLLQAATTEWRQSYGLPDKEGIKERIALRLNRIEVGASRKIMIGTGLLATIGSTAPFVGLFGTVWGIMNAFIGISQTQTTNLAVVAPGIAEALLATGIGLVAAIPAVIIYNHFSRGIAGYKVLMADTAAAVMRLVSRDLDRGEQSGNLYLLEAAQ